MRARSVLLVALGSLACGDGQGRPGGDTATGVTASTGDDATGTGSGDGSSGSEGSGSGSASATAENGDPQCPSPDVLVVLDRTQSMHRTPAGDTPPNDAAGQMSSKWWLAISAIETFTSKFESVVRFGRELFPLDPGDGTCVTLIERLDGTTATNPDCQDRQLLVFPTPQTADAIAQALDPLTTPTSTISPAPA
jgi:hypothetical protein